MISKLFWQWPLYSDWFYCCCILFRFHWSTVSTHTYIDAGSGIDVDDEFENFKKGVTSQTRYICHDDPEWLTPTNDDLKPFDGFELSCSGDNVNQIEIKDATLDFTQVSNRGYMDNIDCDNEVLMSNGYSKSYTYSVNIECSKTTFVYHKYSIKCILHRSYLRDAMFRVHLNLLKSMPNIYPFPYGLRILYDCL